MRILYIAIFILIAGSAMAEDYCPSGTIFSERNSGEDTVGNYEFGYTSGYRENPQGDYSFIYCIKNLSDQTPFEFKWKGPRPSSLLKGKLAYGKDTTDGWQSSATPPEPAAERVLSLGNGGSFTDVKVDTIFRKAQNNSRARLHHAQVTRTPAMLGAWADFLSSLRAEPPQGGIFRRSSGVTFSMPSDPGEWDAYINSENQLPKSPPIRVQAFIAVHYNIETLEMTLVTGLGFSEATPPAQEMADFFKAFTMDYPAIGEAGFDGGGSAFEADQPIVAIGAVSPGGPAFIGIRSATSLGSMEPYLSDQRAIRRVNVPVTLNLNGRPIFEFPMELFGLPDSL